MKNRIAGLLPGGKGLFMAFLLLASPAFSAAGAWIAPEHPRQGDVVAVYVDTTEKKVQSVRVFERDFPLMKGKGANYFGLIAVDHDTKPGNHEAEIISATDGKSLATIKISVVKRKFVEQHLKVDKKTVELSPEDGARAEREAVLISRALGARTPEKFWRGGFTRPVEGEVSSTFGLMRYYNGVAKGFHGGLDIAAPRGEPVRASGSGRVLLADNLFFTGNTVFLDHGYGLITAYFHMDELKVNAGLELREGDLVGLVGSTGRSTGPHLHWSVYVCGVKADPESLLSALAKGFGDGESH